MAVISRVKNAIETGLMPDLGPSPALRAAPRPAEISESGRASVVTTNVVGNGRRFMGSSFVVDAFHLGSLYRAALTER
jgi:hypothetical protein